MVLMLLVVCGREAYRVVALEYRVKGVARLMGDKTWPVPFLLTITSCRRPSDLEREGP